MSTTTAVTRRQFVNSALAVGAAGTVLPGVAAIAAETKTPAGSQQPQRKIKLGLIGCGGRGAWLGGLFKQHGGYEIVATADYVRARADAAGNALGVPAEKRFWGLSAYKKLLASGVEAVTVVNIPRFHAEHAAAAIEAGCHVYAAKPVAVDAPRAMKVAATGKLATQKKLVYLVDYQIPTDPINLEVVARIHDGGLGRIMHVDSLGFSGVWPDPADRRADTLLHPQNWLTTMALSGDFIVEYSVHAIDAVLWAVGRRPVRASGGSRRCRRNAHGDSRDLYLVTYEFDDGLLWTHRCQALNNNAEGFLKCTLYGDIANAELAYSARSFLRGGPKHYGGGKVVSLYDEGAKRNIATFHRSVTEGRCDNATVARAADDALTGVLGREAALRDTAVTMEQLIAENKELPFDLTGAVA
jgi:myo-inositol 2-dehydrogenase / D-chiro-inositol 1-dehydrogenase